MLVDGLPASGTGFLGRLANRNIGVKTPSGTLTLHQASDQQAEQVADRQCQRLVV